MSTWRAAKLRQHLGADETGQGHGLFPYEIIISKRVVVKELDVKLLGMHV